MSAAVVALILRFTLAAVLFAFLLSGFWLIWRDLRQASQQLSVARIPALTLIDRDRPGVTYRFAVPEIRLGRDPACDCRLEDPTVSLVHARLVYRQSQWWVEDLGSKNGTFVNVQPVMHAQVITTGDELRFGAVAFDVRLGSLTTEEMPSPAITSSTESKFPTPGGS